MNTYNVLNDFFTCLSLPTLVLNNSFKIVHSHKYNAELKNSFYTSKAIDILKNSLSYSNPIAINIPNNISYSAIAFYHYDNMPAYILIGPYIIQDNKNTKVNTCDSSILTINKSLLDDVINLYSNLIVNKYKTTTPNGTLSPFVKRAIKYIEKNYSKEISIDDLCSELNINKCYFCCVFKNETGQTFINYLNNYKVEKSKELLTNTDYSLLDIALSVGFNNQSYYSTVFKKLTNQTPIKYRESLKE